MSPAQADNLKHLKNLSMSATPEQRCDWRWVRLHCFRKDQSVTFTGDEQTLTRPIGPLINSLNELGAKCVSLNNNGKAPVKVTGKLLGGKTSIAAFTSQYLSSLLLCTPLAERDSEIDVTLLNEPGYVQMTLDWLDKQNIEYKREELRNFKIKGKQSYKPFNTTIPADFSSATFFLVRCLPLR